MKRAIMFGVLVTIAVFIIQPIRYNYNVPYSCPNPPSNKVIRLELHSCPAAYRENNGQVFAHDYKHGPLYSYIAQFNKSPSIIDKQKLIKNSLYAVLAGAITYAGILRVVKHRSKK